ncbi:FAD/NAD(P)-binding protein [Streptomyces sp. NPDC002067]
MNIAVIGGGPAAVLLLDALAQAVDSLPEGEVTVFDCGRHLWRGRAYQRDTDEVLVNHVPQDMSVRIGDPDHFPRWLNAHGNTGDADTADGWYPSRTLAGDYFADSAREAIARLTAHGRPVRVIADQVTGVELAGDTTYLLTRSGGRHAADRVVLTPGGGTPPDAYGLAAAPHYIADPYPLSDTLAALDPTAHVAVVGSGLTGVDVALALRARDHRGPVTFLSRSGALPAVRQRRARLTLTHLTAEKADERAAGGTLTLTDIVELARAELGLSTEEFEEFGRQLTLAASPLTDLKSQLDAADSPDTRLRTLQFAARAVGQDLWYLLDDEGKAALLASHQRLLLSRCCPMPPANARKLLAMHESGHLHIRDRLVDITPLSGGTFSVETADDSFTVDAVINAMNTPVKRSSGAAREITDALVAAGVAEPHPSGGLRIERHSSRLQRDGRADRRFFAFGDITSGAVFFTFGIPVMQLQVERILSALVAECRTAGPRT